MRGTYVLLVHAPYDLMLSVGGLGDLPLKAGYYAYVGSALGGLGQRVRQHLAKKKNLHWHIDYLLTRTHAVDLIRAKTQARKECEVAKELAKHFACISGFGSGDCKCDSHLFYNRNFHELLRGTLLAFKTCGLKPVKGVRFG